MSLNGYFSITLKAKMARQKQEIEQDSSRQRVSKSVKEPIEDAYNVTIICISVRL